MIEYLSSENWINPQINFLLALQNIRGEHFEIFNRVFLSITILGEMWLPTIICAVIYWCFDFRAGLYLFSLFGFDLLFAQFFKMLACVYRPWILSEKIKPVGLAVPCARGYSFPSGHSATSSSVLGGLAYLKRKNKPVCVMLILLILLVGFSRLWLGVHTPQDVAVGFTIGLALVFGVNFLINFAEKNQKRYFHILFFVNLFATLALIYICYFNSYPLDYIGGKMLVNPKSAIYSCIICFGYALGLIDGAVLCRLFSPFDPKKEGVRFRIIKGFFGSLLIFALLKIGMGFIFEHPTDFKSAIFISFGMGLFITFFYPLVFSKFKCAKER